jgi:hypothetical protein
MSGNRCRIIWICEACMLFIWIFFCFQASTALCIFMSTHANSWIKVAARLNTIWIRFGNRRAIRRRVEPGMARTAIGEITQWGGVADWSGSRTETISSLFQYFYHHILKLWYVIRGTWHVENVPGFMYELQEMKWEVWELQVKRGT